MVLVMTRDLVLSLRPHHWIKNLLVIAAPFFGGVLFESTETVVLSVLAFVAFSLASSAGYILNDLSDTTPDSLHPEKKKRPIVSGRISKPQALLMSMICLALSIAISLMINFSFTLAILAYLLLTVSYTYRLKEIVIVDSFCIAGGFILRIAAGGLATSVAISSWLFITTFLLALLLAFGKRRAELNYSGSSESFRAVLRHYNSGFLDITLSIFSTASILAFALYAVNVGPGIFVSTVPFVCFGVLRYLYLVQLNSNGDPTDVLIKDVWLLGSVFIWLVLTGLIIYFHENSFLPV